MRKSPFSKKHRKSSLRGPVLRPKMNEKRCRTDRKSSKLRKKTSFWRCRNSCVFLHAKNVEKTRKKVKKRVARRNARGQRGGKEGCITLQKSACGRKTCEEFCKEVYAELWHPSSTPRRGAADSIAPRIPPSPLRCLDDLRIGGKITRIGRIGQIGWIGRIGCIRGIGRIGRIGGHSLNVFE